MEPALEDLETIKAYIAKDSKFYARQFNERIFDITETRDIFPEINRKKLEADERNEVSETFFQGYHIIYLTQQENISTAVVIHGRLDLVGMEYKL